MAIPRRIIEVAVRLAPDTKTNQPATFAGTGGSDTATISGTRTSVRITNSGTPVGSQASIDVWGLSPTLMNQLATLGLVFNIVPKNTVTVLAGDEERGLSPVFSGTIFAAYGDYSAAPDVPFHFECNTLLAESVAPTAASSFPGATDVATIMAGFARQMNLGFENNGISVQLPNPYYSGNVKAQMEQCAADAGIMAEVVRGNTLAIWPRGGSRNTPTVPIIAPPPDGQMIQYPAYTQQGIIVRNVFDPRISFGQLVEVRTSLDILKPANGQWAINKLDLALDSEMPGGDWMMTVSAYNPRYPRPIPQQGQAT